MLGKICIIFFVVCWFFSKLTFLKFSFRNTIRVANIQIRPDILVGPDLGPNRFQKLSADDKKSPPAGKGVTFMSLDQKTYPQSSSPGKTQNQPAQLKRLAKILKIMMQQLQLLLYLCCKMTLIKLRRCLAWPAPLLFVKRFTNRQVFSGYSS